MISVPDAGLLPITPRPVWFMNGSITSSGKPCGYVGNAVGVTTPIISQCPVVVSFPFERSTSRPATAGAPGCGGQPSSGITFPSPSASRLGRSRPPTALAVLPRVFEPSSPYSPASGNSPAPTASSTMTHARGTALFYGGFGRRPRPAAPRRVHRAAILAISAGITWAVIKIFPTERKPKNPDKQESSHPPDTDGGGKLFRKSKRAAT